MAEDPNQALRYRKNGHRLACVLARAWRSFVQSKRTSYELAQDFVRCGIQTSMSFEELARRLNSKSTLQSAADILDRIQRRATLTLGNLVPVDDLLQRLPAAPSPRKGDQARYPVHGFLGAYMIVSHPKEVLSSKQEYGQDALREAAARLVPRFESILSAIMNPEERTGFCERLAAFDCAWQSYLGQFVVWKSKDAKILEEDLIRKACQLELSMLHRCHGKGENITHDDLKLTIREGVGYDQKLLRQGLLRITGKLGSDKLKEALSTVRSEFSEARNGRRHGTLPLSMTTVTGRRSKVN